MNQHGTSEPTLPSRVPDVLALDWRYVGAYPILTVSARGLWSCTDSAAGVEAWLAALVAAHGLVAGHDFEGDFLEGRDVTLSARHVRLLVSGSRTDGARRAVLVVKRAFHPTPVVEAPSPPAAAAVSPGASWSDPDDALASASDQEPWSEAFDFGRLVPVTDREIGGEVVPTVIARDVHLALGSGRKFTTWREDCVRRCSLVDGVDVVECSLPAFGKQGRGGHNRTDYVLTVVAAKKIAMASRGARGAAVRDYFLECERRLLAGEPPLPAAQAVAVPPQAPLAVPPLPSALTQDTMPLRMESFLVMSGLPRAEAASRAPGCEASLLRALASAGAAGAAALDAADGSWFFVREALARWWSSERAAVMATRVPRRRRPR